MIRFFIIAGFLVIAATIQNCSPSIDAEAEREKILAIHNQQRVNHFEEILDGTYEVFTNDFISVNRGVISGSAEEEFIARRTAYFGSVDFEKWDDITPPVIRFSDDYTMAYTVVNKEVVVTSQNAEGQPTRGTTIFSWIAIYKKGQEEWKIDAIASTNKSSVVEIIEGS